MIGRRAFLALWSAVPASLLLSACTSQGPQPAAPTAPAALGVIAPTPACGDDPTLAQTEGPYFRRSSPERASLIEPGSGGTRLVLVGTVLSTRCERVPRALLDFWQADENGQYDNSGFRFRGHQFTDEQGRYSLETLVPGLYTGRTRHLHVKVQAPNGPVLTTQLYFPGETRNRSDGIFRQELELKIETEADGGKLGVFDFVVNVA